MTKPRLHLDADVSRKSLLEALIRRGHNVTRTSQADLPDNADDDYQLIDYLDRLLCETTAEEWVGQVRWLSDWNR